MASVISFIRQLADRRSFTKGHKFIISHFYYSKTNSKARETFPDTPVDLMTVVVETP